MLVLSGGQLPNGQEFSSWHANINMLVLSGGQLPNGQEFSSWHANINMITLKCALAQRSLKIAYKL